MDNCTTEEESARKVLDFYVDLIENNRLDGGIYLADNVVLDWFGKTIKDNKKVAMFMNEQVSKVTHKINSATPSDHVGFKESHRIKLTREKPPLLLDSLCTLPSEARTPPKESKPSTSAPEMGQEDGLHNGSQLMSPPKRIRLSTLGDAEETLESEEEAPQLKYVTAEGTVEFHRPSRKKYQTESRWQRPVKLHLGYTSSSFKDCTIYLIIYEGNLKCRRNLMKEFSQSEKCSTQSSV